MDNVNIDPISDFATLGVELASSKRLLVLIVDQPGCEYCAYIYDNEIKPLLRAGNFQTAAVFGRIDMTSDASVIDFQGDVATARDFAQRYHAAMTPTVMFLSSDGTLLHESIVGVSSRDYYGYYLEKAINDAYRLID